MRPEKSREKKFSKGEKQVKNWDKNINTGDALKISANKIN